MKRLITFISLLFLTLKLSLSAQVPTSEPRLAAGQSFSLRVSGVPASDLVQINGNYLVGQKGQVSLPFLKAPLTAAGLTLSELQVKVTAAYLAAEIYAHPTFSVALVAGEAAQQIISIGGEVRAPGDVVFRPGLRLFAAINKVGGPSEYAAMNRVRLIRGKTQRVIDFRKVTEENNVLLQPGDEIAVPAE